MMDDSAVGLFDTAAYKYPDALNVQQQGALYHQLSFSLALAHCSSHCSSQSMFNVMMPPMAPMHCNPPGCTWFGGAMLQPCSGSAAGLHNSNLPIPTSLQHTGSCSNVQQQVPNITASVGNVQTMPHGQPASPVTPGQEEDLTCDDLFAIFSDLGGGQADAGELSSITSDGSQDSGLDSGAANNGLGGNASLSPRGSFPSENHHMDTVTSLPPMDPFSPPSPGGNHHHNTLLSDLDLDLYIERELGELTHHVRPSDANVPLVDLSRCHSDPATALGPPMGGCDLQTCAWPPHPTTPAKAPASSPLRACSLPNAMGFARNSSNHNYNNAAGAMLAPPPPKLRGGIKKPTTDCRRERNKPRPVLNLHDLEGEEQMEGEGDMLARNSLYAMNWMEDVTLPVLHG